MILNLVHRNDSNDSDIWEDAFYDEGDFFVEKKVNYWTDMLKDVLLDSPRVRINLRYDFVVMRY